MCMYVAHRNIFMVKKNHLQLKNYSKLYTLEVGSRCYVDSNNMNRLTSLIKYLDPKITYLNRKLKCLRTNISTISVLCCCALLIPCGEIHLYYLVNREIHLQMSSWVRTVHLISNLYACIKNI